MPADMLSTDTIELAGTVEAPPQRAPRRRAPRLGPLPAAARLHGTSPPGLHGAPPPGLPGASPPGLPGAPPRGTSPPPGSYSTPPLGLFGSPEAERPRHNLPVQRTPFVGRARERAEIAALLLDPRAGLLTLTGVGGTGKARLALQVAEELVPAFPGGVCFVPLASLCEAALVPSAIAQALCLGEGGARPNLERVVQFLRDRRAAAPARQPRAPDGRGAGDRAPRRELPAPLAPRDEPRRAEPLGRAALRRAAAGGAGAARRHGRRRAGELGGEPVLPPGRRDQARLPARPRQRRGDRGDLRAPRRPAARDRARRVAPRVLTPAALLSRFGDRGAAGRASAPAGSFRLLTGGARDLPERQQTMRAAIDWSYGLLDPEEQLAFRTLAVFAGGFSLAMADQMCAFRDPALDALGILESLIDKSLVLQVAGEEPRFQMLTILREYGLDRLVEEGAAAACNRRFVELSLELADRAAEALGGTEQAAWLAALDLDHDNLRLALELALAGADAGAAVRLAAALAVLVHPRALPGGPRVARPGARGRRGRRARARGLGAPGRGEARAPPVRLPRGARCSSGARRSTASSGTRAGSPR